MLGQSSRFVVIVVVVVVVSLSLASDMQATRVRQQLNLIQMSSASIQRRLISIICLTKLFEFPRCQQSNR